MDERFLSAHRASTQPREKTCKLYAQMFSMDMQIKSRKDALFFTKADLPTTEMCMFQNIEHVKVMHCMQIQKPLCAKMCCLCFKIGPLEMQFNLSFSPAMW